MRGEWKFPQVAEAPVEIIDGDRGSNYPKQDDCGSSGHCLFLNTGNVTLTGFNFSDCAFVTKEKDETLRKGKLKRCDVVLTTRGTVGNVAFYDAFVPFEHIRLNSGMVILRANQEELLPRYLYLFLRSRNFKDQVASLTTGSAQPQLPIRDIRKVEIPLPPLSEQRAIAAVLGSLDDKIELNRRMNETLEALAQSLFKSWFVDATQSALPKGWEVRGLDEIATFLNGLALQKFPPNGDGSLPVIKIAQLRAGNTEGADRAGTNLPSQYIIEDGDVLFSWSGSLLVDIWCGGRGALNQHLFKVTSDKFPKWFYYLWTRHYLAAFQNTAADKATTMGHIQRHHLSEAKVFVPPAVELEKMGKQMLPLIEKLIANNLESRTLAALRDALLPKLLSGELRVPTTNKPRDWNP